MNKQIYNAIQKQLIIDDNDSIQYQRSGIDNNVKGLITLDELYDIFQDGPNSMFVFDMKNLSRIFKYDTSRCFMVITKDGKEYPLNKCKRNMDVQFFKIFTDKMYETGNEIIFNVDHMAEHNKLWQTKKVLIANKPSDLYNDKNYTDDIYGYDNTQRILNTTLSNLKFFGKSPAAEYCNKQKITINDSLYQGYLPALGQLMVFAKYLRMVSYVMWFFKMNGIFISNEHWTSTECDGDTAYTITERLAIFPYNKEISIFDVFPFYKKIS